MPKIDFYILPETGRTARLQFACRLIEHAYQQGNRIYIHTKNQEEAHQLDELLWTYRDDSFLPHHIVGDGPNPVPPIQIGFTDVPDTQRDILITLLEDAIPAFFKRFQRIIEIVTSETETQAHARERFKQYRAEGFQITTHKPQTIES